MTKPTCPYLRSLDGKERQRPPVDYPSFENHCQILGSDFLLPLTDQVTFCLSSTHTLCQHYQAAQVASDGIQGDWNSGLKFDEFALNSPQPIQEPKLPLGSNSVGAIPLGEANQSIDDLSDLDEDAWEDGSRRRVWIWAGASLLFLGVLLSGAIFAIYSGWEIALRNLASRPPGQVNTLPGETIAAQPTLFLIVTATSEATPAPLSTAIITTDTPAAPEQSTFPVAVTPTPVLVAIENNSAITTTLDATTIQTGTVVQILPTDPPQENIGATAIPGEVPVVPEPLAQITPVIDVLAPVPTRRPTPEFDIPTSTPVVDSPTLTPTLAPTLGPPLVIFGPDKKEIFAGQCTHIRWRVENVRAVYYENQGVNGTGDREECLKDEASVYSLTVVLSDGSSKVYTTTVGLLIPTATPSPTPTFTEEPEATPTWTVEPATSTPVPDIHYGVTLAINNGNQQRCQPGNECTIGLLTANTGDVIDNISVEFLQSGSWQALLCRQDGVCAVDKLTLNSINPSNTAYIQLRISIPADTSGQQTSYAFRSVSEGSQGAVASDAVILKITVE